jgi:tRNA threonylcarbamoyladenosine biosynthesis protein TsaB
VIDDQLLSREDALNLYAQLQPSAVIGEASQFFEAIENGQVMQDIYPEAEDLGALANGLYKMGAATAIEQVELVYLRGTDAWKKHTRVGMT